MARTEISLPDRSEGVSASVSMLGVGGGWSCVSLWVVSETRCSDCRGEEEAEGVCTAAALEADGEDGTTTAQRNSSSAASLRRRLLLRTNSLTAL